MNWYKAKDIGLSFVAPDSFLEDNGFTRACQYYNQGDLSHIFKTGTLSSEGRDKYTVVPYIDHGIIYKDPDDKTCCLVYLPYQDDDAIRGEVTKWAKSEGLKATLYPKSWYATTCLVIVTLPDVDIEVPLDW